MSISNAILTLQDVTLSYGSQPVLRAVSMAVHEGERLGLIGRNGSGKSTLLKLMSGALAPDNGIVTRMTGLRVSMLSQGTRLDDDFTVQQAIDSAGTPVTRVRDAYDRAVTALATTPHEDAAHEAMQQEVTALTHQMELLGGWDLPTEKKRLFTELALPAGERRLGSLSGGERRRVELAVCVLERPDLLLLDEPTNHIDTRSVEWIEHYLERYTGACVLVTHDRYFLDRVVSRIVELEFSEIFSFSGTYAQLLEYKASIESVRENTELNRLGLIRRELEWVRRGPKARGTKQKARMQRFEETVEKGPPDKHREFEFAIPQPERLGKTVVNAREVTHGFNGDMLIQKFEVIMQKGMRVGIIGPNGCGKSTLLRVLMGLEEPRKGRVTIGESVQFLYVDQQHEFINPAENVLDFVSNGQRFWDVGQRRVFVPAYLERFMFDASGVFTSMGDLSGGERNRLDLARQLLRGGNFLVLDEPTNDLDLYTLRVLEELILDFDGCAVIVSHDRYFLNRVCTHMWVFEGEGEIVPIVGNYEDVQRWRSQKKEAAKAEARQAAPEKKEATKPARDTKRLTYMEKKELAGMESRILEAEEEVARLEAQMASPAFYKQDTAAIRETLDALAAARTEVEKRYERWQELEARA